MAHHVDWLARHGQSVLVGGHDEQNSGRLTGRREARSRGPRPRSAQSTPHLDFLFAIRGRSVRWEGLTGP
jgi:hypothetical protein